MKISWIFYNSEEGAMSVGPLYTRAVRKFNWWRYGRKCSTISLYLTKLYVTYNFAVASSVIYSEIRQNVSNSVWWGPREWVQGPGLAPNYQATYV